LLKKINGELVFMGSYLQFKQIIRQFDSIRNKKIQKIKTLTNSNFGV
jgi:hypothetical protein